MREERTAEEINKAYERCKACRWHENKKRSVATMICLRKPFADWSTLIFNWCEHWERKEKKQ